MRLIVIGDLHGCFDELQELLAQLTPGDEDLVTCVGDFLTKGPRPVDCVDLWRRNGWKAVLGNNDRRVLRAIRGEGPSEGVETDARTLSKRAELVEFLESLPATIDLPLHEAAIVHGGVVPDESFEKAAGRTADVLTLRDVVRDEDGWRAAREEDPREARRFWADEWHGDRVVVYGHTPVREPALHHRAIGIDTGCVYGWSLTAAVQERGAWSTVSVTAERAWMQR